MHDNEVIQITVTSWRRESELIHLHTTRNPIRRGREIRVIGSGPVERVCDHLVSPKSTIPVVVELEVSGGLVKTVEIQNVVDHIVRIEQVYNSRILIGYSPLGWVEREIEYEVCTAVGASSTQVIRVFVLLREDIVTTSVCELRTSDTVCVVPAKG